MTASALFDFLNTPGLPPHGFCLLWNPALIWLHAVSDAVIGVSYYIIPLALAYFVSQRRDLAFGWIFWLFAAFILACGTTHLLEIWTLWHPDYGLQGVVKAMTAVVSLVTAFMLWPLAIRVSAFPTPAQFRRVSDELALRADERNTALRRLRQTEESFRLLINGVTDQAILMLDRNGGVSTWNTGAERLTGYHEAEILGSDFSLFYTEEDRRAGSPALALEKVSGDGRYEAEGWRVRKGGDRFWANVIIEALRDEAGRLIGYAEVTRDITARRRAEEALEHSRAALAQMQKMETVGQLAGGIAHDFNNLLTVILGGASLLERRINHDIADEAGRILAAIKEASQRAASLTHQLLAFSRKQTLAPRVTDANWLIAGMSELLSRTIGEGIVIQTVLADDLWRTYVDPNQLENAVLNLAVNARDAMRDGGTLVLKTGNVVLDDAYAMGQGVTPGPYVVITVTDTSVGMTEEVMRRAFDPFFTTKAEGQGTGLGLSQVFGFVSQSGGHVRLQSEVGHGTTARIYLPRHLADLDAGPADPPRLSDMPRGSETVLVVEDHANVRDYVASALRHLGYDVLQAPNAERALEVLTRDGAPALLLTDIGLPGLNGRELAEQALACAPDLKVMFMTAYSRNATAAGGAHPEIGVILKPFTIDTLARKLRRVLDGDE